MLKVRFIAIYCEQIFYIVQSTVPSSHDVPLTVDLSDSEPICTCTPLNPLFVLTNADQSRRECCILVEWSGCRGTRRVPVVSNGTGRRFHIFSPILVTCDLFLSQGRTRHSISQRGRRGWCIRNYLRRSEADAFRGMGLPGKSAGSFGG